MFTSQKNGIRTLMLFGITMFYTSKLSYSQCVTYTGVDLGGGAYEWSLSTGGSIPSGTLPTTINACDSVKLDFNLCTLSDPTGAGGSCVGQEPGWPTTSWDGCIQESLTNLNGIIYLTNGAVMRYTGTITVASTGMFRLDGANTIIILNGSLSNNGGELKFENGARLDINGAWNNQTTGIPPAPAGKVTGEGSLRCCGSSQNTSPAGWSPSCVFDDCSHHVIACNSGTGVQNLPVELLNFSAERNSLGESVLKWATVWEENNEYFTIQRSTDGINFEDIDYVDGAGTTQSITNYTYIDANAPSELVYYRLVQTDYDGTTEILKIRAVNTEDIQKLDVYPNPSDGIFNYLYTGTQEDETILVEVIDELGRTIHSDRIVSQENVLNGSFDLSDYAKGIYYLRINGAGNIAQKILSLDK